MSDDELSSLVDDVLSSGKHRILPRGEQEEQRGSEERLHARVIAEQMQQLASSLVGPYDEGAQPVERWYFEVRGQQVGPLTLQQARKLWNDGELGPDSFCWHEGFSSWIALSKVTELAAALAPRIPPPRRMEPTPSPSEARASLWSPRAAELAEELSQPPAQPAPLETPNEAEQPAGIYYVLSPPPTPPAPAPPRTSALTQSLITGVVAGMVMALILLLAWGRGPLGSAPAPVLQPAPVVAVIPAAPAANPEPAPAVAAPPAPVAAAPAPTAPVQAPPSVVPPPSQPRLIPIEAVARRLPAPTQASKPVAEKRAPPAQGEVAFEEDAPAAKAADPAEDPNAVESAARDGFEEAFGVDEEVEEAPTVEEKKPVYVPPPAGGAPLPQQLGQAQILEVVLANKGAVQTCVQAHRPANSEASRMVMQWRISPDGKVGGVKPVSPEELVESSLAECLAKVINAWSFPPHQEQMEPVVLPFAF